MTYEINPQCRFCGRVVSHGESCPEYQGIRHTWIEPEEYAYGARGPIFGRLGKARLVRNSYHRGDNDLPYGSLVSFRASIPDTYSSIPAKIRHKGKTVACYVRMGDGSLEILPEGNSQFPAYDCPTCGELMTFHGDYCEETGERIFACEGCAHEAQEDLLSKCCTEDSF